MGATGEEAIQHCRTYAYEAERRMGELLREKPFLRAVLVCVLVPLLFRSFQ